MGDLDVVVLGGAGVDTIVRVPELTVPPGDSLVTPVRDFVAHSGNGVALGFHALGKKVHFVDFIADDALGLMIRERYRTAGLAFDALPAPWGTPRSVNLVDDAGRRFSFHDPRRPAGLVMPPEAYLPLLRRTRHLHVATDRAGAALGEATRLGVSTSTDIHAWDGVNPWPLPLTREADVVFLSAEGAPGRIDELMRGILRDGRATLVVATEGAAGCRVLRRDEPRIELFPSVEPRRPVVDSNGAGDGFSTAFMSRWLDGRPVDECALAGAVSGAYACGSHGTHEDLISGEDLAAGVASAVSRPARADTRGAPRAPGP